MESESTAVQTESFETQAAKLRSNPAYYDAGHYQHREVQKQMENLYKQKHGQQQPQQDEHGQDFQPEPTKRADDGGDDPRSQAEAELAKLTELTGEDYSGEDLDGVTPERIEGYRQLVLLEEGKFNELDASLSQAAYKSGFPEKTVRTLRNFLRETAEANDPLTKDILRLVVQHIYQKRRS